jgi:hypothetical protein
VRAFHHDPRDGCAGGCQQSLAEVTDGADLLRRIRPDTDKSGAAMRAGPLGVLPATADVLHHADVQARITNDTHGHDHLADRDTWPTSTPGCSRSSIRPCACSAHLYVLDEPPRPAEISPKVQPERAPRGSL